MVNISCATLKDCTMRNSTFINACIYKFANLKNTAVTDNP